MSDGPHRSLPMRRPWKDLAERAAKAAFSTDEVCEALPRALRREFREAPVEAVREILGGGAQGSLLSKEIVEQLESARGACRGSSAGTALIDCAIEAVTSGLKGDPACQAAMENALDACSLYSFRSVEEHYQREATTHSARFVRGRLDAARHQCDFGALAGELLAPAKPKGRPNNLPKRAGIDDGPEL